MATAKAQCRADIAVSSGLGESVAVSPGSHDLEPALDLILQPLLIETLAAIGEGKALEEALPVDTDAEVLSAALHRLVSIRVVEPSSARLLGRHTLTHRGVRLLRLLDDLDAAIVRSDKTHRG